MSDIDWQMVFEAAEQDATREWEAGNGGEEAYVAVSIAASVHVVRALFGARGVPPEVDLDAVMHDFAAATFELGPAAKVFGPVSLHPMVNVFQNGERRVQPAYQLLPVGLETPVIMTREEMATNMQVIAERNILGSVLVAASGIRDVLRHLQKQQVIGATGAAFQREAAARNPEQTTEYALRIATAERRERLAREARDTLATLFPADAASPKANMSEEEQEREAEALRRLLVANESLQTYARAHLRQAKGASPETTNEEVMRTPETDSTE